MYMLFMSKDTHRLYAVEENGDSSLNKLNNQDIILGIYDSSSEIPLLIDNFKCENPEVPLYDTKVNYK